MHLAETANEDIARLCIFLNANGRILFLDTVQTGDDLVVFALLLRRHSKADARLGEIDRIELHGGGRIAKRIAGRGILELRNGADVPCVQLADVLALFPTEKHGRGGLFGLLRVGIVQLGVHVDGAAEHFDDGVFAELVDNCFHDLCGEFSILFDLDRIACLCVNRGARFYLVRGGQIMHHVIEQRRDADVGGCGSAANGGHDSLAYTLGETPQNLIAGELALLKIFLHEFFIRLGGSFRQLFVEALRFICECGGNIDLFFALAVKQLCCHVDNIDVSFERTALNDRELDRDNGRTKLFIDRSHDLLEIRIFSIHLIDDHHARLMLLFTHCHCLFSADNGAGDCADDDQRAVRKCHSGGYFAIEVEETGRVNHIDLRVFPLERRKRHVDRNGPLDLFGIKIRRGGAVFNLTHAVNKTRIEQHGLGQRGLALAAMTENANVANVFRGVFLHSETPYILVCFRIHKSIREFPKMCIRAHGKTHFSQILYYQFPQGL